MKFINERKVSLITYVAVWIWMEEVYCEPSQTSKIKIFAKIVNGWLFS